MIQAKILYKQPFPPIGAISAGCQGRSTPYQGAPEWQPKTICHINGWPSPSHKATSCFYTLRAVIYMLISCWQFSLRSFSRTREQSPDPLGSSDFDSVLRTWGICRLLSECISSYCLVINQMVLTEHPFGHGVFRRSYRTHVMQRELSTRAPIWTG